MSAFLLPSRVCGAMGRGWAFLLLLACGTPTFSVPSGEDGGGVPAPQPMSEDFAEVGSDAGGVGQDPDSAVGGSPPGNPFCDALGLSTTVFQEGSPQPGFGERVGEFSATTLAGEAFQFSADWGCESHVLFVYFPDPRSSPQGAWRGDALFNTSLGPLFSQGPLNTRYLFFSFEADLQARRARLQDLQARLEQALAASALDEAAREYWRSRFLFLTDRIVDVGGGVGAFVRDYLAYLGTDGSLENLGDRGQARAPWPFVLGIDRDQRLDPAGNLSPAVGRASELGMAAYLGHYYEYRFQLEQELASQKGVTELPLVDERTGERVFVRGVTLPEPQAMAAFDTLEVDVEILCDDRNPFACSEWDRIAHVHWCTDGEACEEPWEIARWITPYWRRGRQHWTLDASPFLGLLRAGGPTHFRVTLGPAWERATLWDARVSLRLRATGEALPASGGALAFRGGKFDADYNAREPFVFVPPKDSARVELVTLLSGHGQEAGNNCAEWCDHRHTFVVNGVELPELRHTGERIGAARGCAARAGQGVLPGQWGNWAQSRAYWCPGLPVVASRVDITSQVQLGTANQLEYRASFAGGEPSGGNIALSAYVVWYGP